MKIIITALIYSFIVLANTSLLGPDKDKDGIRDDVNQWLIEKKGVYSSSITRELKILYKRLIKVYSIKTKEEVALFNKSIIYSKGCLVGLSGNNITFAFEQYNKFIDLVFNTEERKSVYKKFNPDTSELPFSDEKYLGITKSGQFLQACSYKDESEKEKLEKEK